MFYRSQGGCCHTVEISVIPNIEYSYTQMHFPFDCLFKQRENRLGRIRMTEQKT